jgi:pilus assembly protein Flp/PilA
VTAKLFFEAFTARCVLVSMRRLKSASNRNEDRAMAKVRARFVTDESGATAIEYGLIAGLITLLIIAPVTQIGNTVFQFFAAVLAGFSSP